MLMCVQDAKNFAGLKVNMLTYNIECYHKDVHVFIVMYIICTVIKTMLKQRNIYRRLCIYTRLYLLTNYGTAQFKL